MCYSMYFERQVEACIFSLLTVLNNREYHIHISFFSADGLKEVLVNNYDEINARMEEGTVNKPRHILTQRARI